MSLLQLNENDFLDVDKINRFFVEEGNLILITNSERITVPPSMVRTSLTAIFRNEASKRLTKQYTAV